jgi:hypothetical protein
METLSIELYVVRNKEGKFFRAKGYGGSGETWVKDLQKAKFYGKIGGARTTVTYFANHYSTFGTPDVIKLTSCTLEVIDESKRVEKALQKIRLKEEKYKYRRAELIRLENEKALREAEETIRRLKNENNTR